MKLPDLDPDKAYILNNLLLPISKIEVGPIVSALTFPVGIDGDRVLVATHRDHVEVPRHAVSLKDIKALEIELIDLRPQQYEKTSLRPNSGFSLRPRQQDAWEAIQKKGLGLVEMACGSGKTILGLWVASQMQVPTLVVSPQKAHLDNWMIELNNWFKLDTEVGWIRGEKLEYDRELVFATVQTLAKRAVQGKLPPDFGRRFGLVIYDEAHHMAAQWFCESADVVSGQRMGLTATVNRINRDEGIFLSHLGDVVHTDLAQDLEPTFFVVETGVALLEEDIETVTDAGGNINVPLVRSWLAKHSKRNAVISSVLSQCISEGRCIYGLSHSVEHVEEFNLIFPHSGLITGKTKHENRLDILSSERLIFATMGVGAEAYNKPDLDTLLLMTPFSAHSHAAPMFHQTVGRIQRDVTGKLSPHVYLFMDTGVEISKAMTFSLINEAKSKGYKIEWTKKDTHHHRDW